MRSRDGDGSIEMAYKENVDSFSPSRDGLTCQARLGCHMDSDGCHARVARSYPRKSAKLRQSKCQSVRFAMDQGTGKGHKRTAWCSQSNRRYEDRENDDGETIPTFSQSEP
jgi:hypothetical protein